MGRQHLTPALRGENDADYVTCRTLRHAWEPTGAGDRRPEFGVLVCLRCIRCGTLRYDKFAWQTGERIAPPSYVWPDGYRDAEGHDSAWWRQTWGENVTKTGLAVRADEPEPKPKRRGRRA